MNSKNATVHPKKGLCAEMHWCVKNWPRLMKSFEFFKSQAPPIH